MKKYLSTILLYSTISAFLPFAALAFTTGLLGYSGPDITVNTTSTQSVFGVGADGTVLVASSTAPNGLEWEAQKGASGGAGSATTTYLFPITNNVNVIGMATATVSTSGIISSVDFTTFNNKLSTSTGLSSSNFATTSLSAWINNLNWVQSSSLSAYELSVSAGTNVQVYFGDKVFRQASTTSITEGTNAYFTDARARAALSSTVIQFATISSTQATLASTTLNGTTYISTSTQNGWLNATGTLDTVSACGTSPTIRGSHGAGKVTTGSNASSTCTITLSPAPFAAPVGCIAMSQTTSSVNYKCVPSATTLVISTVSSSAMISNTLSYWVWGNW